MANFTTSVTRIQDLCGNHSLATAALVGRFYNTRHRGLLESFEWSRKKQEILIVIAADESSGTLSVTNGGSTATITGGSWTSADEGKYVRIGSDNELYVVKTVSGATVTFGDLNGTTVAYQGTTAATATYVMFERFYSLGTAVESIVSVVHNTSKLGEIDQESLDAIDPARTSTGTQATAFARGPRDMSGTSDLVQIEFTPRLTAATVVRVIIKKGHTDLASTTNPIVPSGPLEWQAAADTCRHLFAKTKDERWLTLAKDYDGQGEISLEREKTLDAHKFGLSPAIKDAGAWSRAGTDYETDHDLFPPGH